MMVQTFNPSTQELEGETGGSLWIQAQPGLYNKFQVNQGCIARLCLKTTATSYWTLVNQTPVMYSITGNTFLLKELLF